MRRTLLLLASLASLTFPADGASPLKVLSAPNVLRVGTPENIFVECQDYTGVDMRVEVIVMSHPTKSKKLDHIALTLKNGNNFQASGSITIPPMEFRRDPSMKQYVYLIAQFPDKTLEKVVLVSFQSGYIFIQTDKTLYTPNSKVYYRLFALTPGLEPVQRNRTTKIDPVVVVEVVTPDAIVLPLNPVLPKSGVYSGQYQLGEAVSAGMWKVVAKFQSNPQQNFSAEFEVKEYVLPRFEVKLTPLSSFFYVDAEELSVDITAKYLFGEEVDGTAYVVFGIIQEGQKKSFPGSLQRVPIQTGSGRATLRRQHITQTFPNILNLEKKSIYVAASVLTEHGSEMVEAELRGIPIVQSPYTIHLTRTPKYFKPGMTFDVWVEVLNPDESPAAGVPVVVNPGEVNGITEDNGMARLTINTVATSARLEITAKTNDPHISSQRQTSATMTSLPYTTASNNYIQISVNETQPRLGHILTVNFHLNGPPNENDITYLILSRGQLVKHGRVRRTEGLITIFPVTREMVPSFRIVAYYHPNDNEVVSDSVWVNVKVSCVSTLRLEPSRDVPSYEPRKTFGMKITGDPGATVGLVAVDKGVYALNNKLRLTQKKVWDIVEKYDTGCTPGGGKDSMGVFFDAGLLLETSTASGTPYRQDLKCPSTRRQKRDAEVTTNTEDDFYIDSMEIIGRTWFPESWMWTDVTLPTCPLHISRCETTSLQNTVPLRDSITTWQFIGISMSRFHGICVGDPMSVTVKKEFFIDLRLPYSAVHGEQLEIKAILHNHSPDPVTVRVELLEEQHMCSAAYSRGKYVQEVNIGAQTTRSVPFVIIPMKAGEYSIEVRAAVKDSVMSDGIKKKLVVVPQGVLVKSPQILTLDPTKTGGKQEETLNSGIPKHSLVPNTTTSTQISVTGREPVSTLVENIISGSSMVSLIYQPSGDGEANMIHMTLPLIATIYLDKTNQWEAVGFQKRNEALEHIKTGHIGQLAFRNQQDGSFSKLARGKKSTWLTAYVVKMFSMARHLLTVQEHEICDAVKFLIINTQRPDGAFIEIGSVAHAEMMGDMTGINSDISLTAFCLIAMQESRSVCSPHVISLPGSIDKAVAYLERRLPTVTNPYAVAIASYALANENKLNKRLLYQFASPDLSHWPVRSSHLYTLEATGYVLLALAKAKDLEEARPVVRWFNKQQRVDGGYGSTQATLLVYQAVAEYWESTKEQDYDLNVDITAPGRPKPFKVHFNRDNYHTTRTVAVMGINQNVTVVATGTGEATLRMVSLYYAAPRQTQSDCEKFSLSVQLLPEKIDETEMVYRLRIEVLYKHQTQDASLSVLDIGLLTGFIPNKEDLDALSRGQDSTIAKYEMNTALSERGSLTIYLDGVSHTQPKEISFRLHQVLIVGFLQPAAVSVYEYYDQRGCMKFYHPRKNAGQLLQLCNGEECQCAEESCNMLKKGTVSNYLRTAKLCGSVTDSTAFAYKVRLVEFTEGSITDQYKMQVLQSIKEGFVDAAPQGKVRMFLSLPHCREALNLVKDKTYLIMGSARDVHRVEQTQTFRYVLWENTWVEYWPTQEECQLDEFRRACLGLEDMVTEHNIFGCRF